MLKNVERNLEIRRSSRSKVVVYFEVMEWPSEIERDGAIYTLHKIITVGVSKHRIYLTMLEYVRWEIQIDSSLAGSDIFDGGRIYPF
jgi:hypothetical protein